MSEAEAIGRATEPSTVESLSGDFAALGLRAGDIALVHSSLSALGWVAGGPVAVIDALCGVLGSRGRWSCRVIRPVCLSLPIG